MKNHVPEEKMLDERCVNGVPMYLTLARHRNNDQPAIRASHLAFSKIVPVTKIFSSLKISWL